MESFDRGEHVVAAFLDVKKAFDNVWHNGLRYKIFQLDLPTEMTRWLSDILVGRVIQVNVNGFMSNQSRGAMGFCPESITFSYLHRRSSNFARQTKFSLPVRWWYCTMGFQIKRALCIKMFATRASKLGNVVCQMENQTKSRKDQSDYILQVHTRQKNRT